MRRAAALASVTLALLGLASTVYAERTQVGDLVVFLKGGLDPRTLPRDRAAPVGVKLEAGIETADDAPLPRVREIRLELAWRGALSTKGLPVCARRSLKSQSIKGAIAVCGGAVVGRGRMYSRVFLPNQEPFGLHSRLVAFNGKTAGGAPAVWVLGYSADPPISVVIPFHLRHQAGRFHTVLVSVVPRSVGPWPHFARFHMTIFRRFTYRGRRRSYLSASCPLPKRLTAAPLSLARATFLLAGGGPRLEIETVRTCRAK